MQVPPELIKVLHGVVHLLSAVGSGPGWPMSGCLLPSGSPWGLACGEALLEMGRSGGHQPGTYSVALFLLPSCLWLCPPLRS